MPASVRALPDLEIRGDGVVMGRAQWDVALPVDTGTHVFSATARGVAPWEKGVTLREDGAHVTVFFEDPPAPAKPIEIVAPPAREVAKGEPPMSHAMRTAGLVVGAIGLVGIGVASGAGIRAITTRNANGDHCGADDTCDPTGLDLRAQSLTAGTWSTAMFVTGGVALAAGVTLVVIAPSSPGGATSSSASASSGSTGGSDGTSTSTSTGSCTTDADNDGAISWQCAGGNDCADQDSRAHPGAAFSTGGAIQGPRSPGTLAYDFNCDQFETPQTLTLKCTGMPCTTPSSVHGFQQAVSCGSTGMLGHCGGLPCEWISEGTMVIQACK